MQSLVAFRSELAKLWRRERSDLHPSDPRTNLTEGELAAAADLVTRLAVALAPLEALPAQAQRLDRLVSCHRDVVRSLSADGIGSAAAFAGTDGLALDTAFDAIVGAAAADVAVMPAEY